MKKKELTILIILIVVVIGIILLINYIRANGQNNGNPEETIKCIGEKARLVVSPTCGHCANQKKMLSDYYPEYEKYIQLLDVNKNPEIVKEYGIRGVPAWIVGDKIYEGERTIPKIKEITGC